MVNEVNTLPGFTNISMYPKVMEALGISYPELIDRLIRHALKRAASGTDKARARVWARRRAGVKTQIARRRPRPALLAET